MLRRQLARIAGGERSPGAARFATGHEAIDTALGGGFARGRVHELFAAEADDSASSLGFAAMLAIQAASGRPILWLKTDEAERRGQEDHRHAAETAQLDHQQAQHHHHEQRHAGIHGLLPALGVLDRCPTFPQGLDLERIGRANDVAVMIFSEFGRRVPENTSLGTDHGAAGAGFLVGARVNGTMIGEFPGLAKLDEQGTSPKTPWHGGGV